MTHDVANIRRDFSALASEVDNINLRGDNGDANNNQIQNIEQLSNDTLSGDNAVYNCGTCVLKSVANCNISITSRTPPTPSGNLGSLPSENHHLISGSAGREYHKNNIVAIAEATFVFSRILSLANDPSKEDSSPFQLQIGLVNEAQLVLTSIYNEKHSRLAYI
ncbi:24452_t:CDS:2 [Gigaspora margarita]|uniref:24452_t:CDS:1 n=1 Tax=Gigaspora margarita TaxID=4874 RepID=A0ABM8W6K6_GIGMA|nr:24452_t:CDS:2 [Gigaspora margarita]